MVCSCWTLSGTWWYFPSRAAVQIKCLTVAKKAKQALHVLDRYHVVAKLHKAVDEVRAGEARELARQGYEPVLKHSRWCFLKREENLTVEQQLKLRDVLQYDLRTVRAFLLKEAFDSFWTYTAAAWAGWFLNKWCARTLRAHAPLLLNWFRARKQISAGAVEGLNANAKLAIRKARGFRTYEVIETVLYHQLGHLPEPEGIHSFC